MIAHTLSTHTMNTHNECSSKLSQHNAYSQFLHLETPTGCPSVPPDKNVIFFLMFIRIVIT
jgi:hypothetical protein